MRFFLNARSTFITSTSSSSTSRMLSMRSSTWLLVSSKRRRYARPGEKECGAAARRRLQPHAPTPRLNHLLHDGEPDPRSFDLVTGLKRLEDAPDAFVIL